MSQPLPLVTVIVPAFNCAATLQRTLQSVAAQSYRNLEILVVDDGSTDSTAAVAQAFCKDEPRARLIRKANGGVASARNRGIAEARGDWVAPVDGDDLWHPLKIEKQVAAALAAPELPGFVYCWSRHIDAHDRVVGSGPRLILQGNAFRQLAYLNAVRNGSALLISTSAARQVGGYDESLRAEHAQGCEDVMIQLRLASRYPIACVPEHLVGYRVSGQMSSDVDQISRSWQLVYRRMAAADPSLDRKILRRVAGRSAFDDAELKAARGSPLAALPALARALALDPGRCGALLLYRLARRGAHAVRGRRRFGALRSFAETDPTDLIQHEPDALAGFAALLDALEQRRLRALGRTAQP